MITKIAITITIVLVIAMMIYLIWFKWPLPPQGNYIDKDGIYIKDCNFFGEIDPNSKIKW